jgi:hypothetical protein
MRTAEPAPPPPPFITDAHTLQKKRSIGRDCLTCINNNLLDTWTQVHPALVSNQAQRYTRTIPSGGKTKSLPLAALEQQQPLFQQLLLSRQMKVKTQQKY